MKLTKINKLIQVTTIQLISISHKKFGLKVGFEHGEIGMQTEYSRSKNNEQVPAFWSMMYCFVDKISMNHSFKLP